MPQELNVLRCYSCQTFQVHIVKKATKWNCKMCGNKQSTIKVYVRGSGKECREYVQQMNQKHIESLEAGEKPQDVPEDNDKEEPNTCKKLKLDKPSKNSSKWEYFRAKDNEDKDKENNVNALDDRVERENAGDDTGVTDEGSNLKLGEKNFEHLKKKRDLQKVNVFESTNSNEDLDSILDF